MTINTDFCTINERITGSQLLNSILIICQWIVTHIVISICMICFSTHRSTTSMTYSNNNESQLRQTGIIYIIHSKACRHILKKRSRIDVRNNGINLRRVKICRFPHHAIKISHTISRFHLKTLRSFPSHLINRLQVRFFQFHNHLST